MLIFLTTYFFPDFLQVTKDIQPFADPGIQSRKLVKVRASPEKCKLALIIFLTVYTALKNIH